MGGRDFYDVYLARSQGSDYVTWTGRLANTSSCGEGGYGYHASGHEDQDGVHVEAWRRRNVAVCGMEESETSNAISSAVSASDTFDRG